MLRPVNSEVGVREYAQMQHEKEMLKMETEYQLEAKRLELAVTQIDVKVGAWSRIPLTIIKLPVYCLLALGYVVLQIRGAQPDERFWEFMKR